MTDTKTQLSLLRMETMQFRAEIKGMTIEEIDAHRKVLEERIAAIVAKYGKKARR